MGRIGRVPDYAEGRRFQIRRGHFHVCPGYQLLALDRTPVEPFVGAVSDTVAFTGPSTMLRRDTRSGVRELCWLSRPDVVSLRMHQRYRMANPAGPPNLQLDRASGSTTR